MRTILRNALAKPQQGGLGSHIRERFAVAGGVELDLPGRTDTPRPADFDS
nr:hypothetical protein [uncultured Halomonas sp.]